MGARLVRRTPPKPPRPAPTVGERVATGYAIRCPKCGREAAFERAHYFLHGAEARKAVEARTVEGVKLGGGFMVVRYPRLLDWKEIRAQRRLGDLGICRCGHCGFLGKYELRWPNDAYYAVSLRGRTLWMANRDHVLRLRGYVASEDRQNVPGARWISRVPRVFLAARNRAELVRKLDRLLLDGPEPRAVPARPSIPRPRR